MTLAMNEAQAQRATWQKKPFGKTPAGVEVDQYIFTNKNGMVAKIITYGGIVTELHTPDKEGKFADVVLGFDSLEGYLAGHPFFGCITGRVANRIAGGKFTLDGKEYKLHVNNGPNSLHGGKEGFDKKVWTVVGTIEGQGYQGLKLHYVSKDGEEGYPGTLDTTVTYYLTDNDELKIEYSATTDAATPVNLTNHTYFNLNGAKEDVLSHELQLASTTYTVANEVLIPTGEIKEVKDTPLDFTKLTPIGQRIKDLPATKGYDHNYVITSDGKPITLTAVVREPKSGRVMIMSTTEPGVQLYTGNGLDTKGGKGGVHYKNYYGLCLEAQHYPDSINQPKFPSTVLKPGQTYKQTTTYKFAVEK